MIAELGLAALWLAAALAALQLVTGALAVRQDAGKGEAAIGVRDDDVDIGGTNVNVELKHQLAAYVVGFAPVSANTDVFARFGYGTTKIKGSALGVSASDDGSSWNYGVGAQHHFDGVNGVRIDWTRHDFDGGNADVWAVAYTRKF